MNKNRMRAFTLVELLAVIVILAIILVIAVPKVMSVIEDSKKATLESTAKMIASAAEKAKVQNTVLGKIENITCDDVVKLNDIDYDKCIIEFDNSGNALVTIKGKGKFSNLNVCIGDKSNATSSNDACTASYGKASTYIEKLEAFTTNNGLIVDTTSDKNVRYAGSNPNNKVYFNCKDIDSNGVSYGEANYDYASSCEVWRIIGVFEVDNGSGKIEKRVKLVRDALPIQMSLDSSIVGEGIENSVNSGRGINQWGKSTYEDGSIYEGADLMNMLNGYYIGKLDSECTYCDGPNQGTCKNDCSSYITPLSNTTLSMVEYVLWKRGAQKAISTMPVETMYTNERGTILGKICLPTSTYDDKPSCTDTVNRTTEWIGKIGLIYPSDYAYASANESCSSDIFGEESTCKNNNWLHPSSWYWTFSPRANTNDAAYVWNVGVTNGVSYSPAYNGGGVRPSLYLSSNVQIIGGDGTDSSPYKLSLNL